MKQIIGYLDNKSIGYLDSALPENIDMNNPAKYPEFSKRLSQVWRECKGAPEKQTQLAKWLGFAQPTVNNWINGNALPGLETAVMLANKFDCNPIWLITGNGSKYLSEEEAVVEFTAVSPLASTVGLVTNGKANEVAPEASIAPINVPRYAVPPTVKAVVEA